MRALLATLGLMTLGALILGSACALLSSAAGKKKRYAFYYAFVVVFGGGACLVLANAIARWGKL